MLYFIILGVSKFCVYTCSLPICGYIDQGEYVTEDAWLSVLLVLLLYQPSPNSFHPRPNHFFSLCLASCYWLFISSRISKRLSIFPPDASFDMCRLWETLKAARGDRHPAFSLVEALAMYTCHVREKRQRWRRGRVAYIKRKTSNRTDVEWMDE